MTINADCTFCHGPAFATRAIYIHPYTPEEVELLKKIDQNKLEALRKVHNNWLIACYKCLAEKCPKDTDGVSNTPRDANIISVQEP